jgi:ABC-type molybdate transport system substrate-binding protein
MELRRRALIRAGLAIGGLCLFSVLVFGQALASSLEVFHADSLAGPMHELKKAFEAKYQGGHDQPDLGSLQATCRTHLERGDL